jgi:exonuclease SbcD
MVRVAHFADIHYSNGTLAEVDRCFGFAVDTAIARQVQCAIITGDATDHALDVHSPAVRALATQIRRLTDHCPVLLVQGTYSHEPPGTLDIFGLLGGRFPVHVSNRIEQVALLVDGTWAASPSWRFDAVPSSTAALFSVLPTANKAALAAAVGATNVAEAYGHEVAAILQGFNPSNALARSLGVPTILASHGTVSGSISEHGVPMAGYDHEFTTGSLFAAGATATMLGHIHKHQSWNDSRQLIAYAGSIARLHYGEQGDKGFIDWTVDAEATSFEFVVTPAKRTIDVTFDGPPDIEQLRQLVQSNDVAGAHVRVQWVTAESERDLVDRQAVLSVLAGAAEVKLEGRIIATTTARAAGISQTSSLEGKIQMWADSSAIPASPLLACLEALRTSTPEAIVDRVLRGPTPVPSPASLLALNSDVPSPSIVDTSASTHEARSLELF